MISFQLRVLEPKSSHLWEETPIIILFLLLLFKCWKTKKRLLFKGVIKALFSEQSGGKYTMAVPNIVFLFFCINDQIIASSAGRGRGVTL